VFRHCSIQRQFRPLDYEKLTQTGSQCICGFAAVTAADQGERTYARLPDWGYGHKTVCHAHGEYAGADDGDGFCEVHVNTIAGFWPLLRFWLCPHRGIPQEKLPLYPGFFQFVHNARRRGKALLGALAGGLFG
jgi:transposase